MLGGGGGSLTVGERAREMMSPFISPSLSPDTVPPLPHLPAELPKVIMTRESGLCGACKTIGTAGEMLSGPNGMLVNVVANYAKKMLVSNVVFWREYAALGTSTTQGGQSMALVFHPHCARPNWTGPLPPNPLPTF